MKKKNVCFYILNYFIVGDAGRQVGQCTYRELGGYVDIKIRAWIKV